MVKNKKMSKTSIAVIVLALLLVFSLVMGMTGAWFTDKDDSAEKAMQFGTVSITSTSATGVAVSNAVDTGLTKLMPGSTISGNVHIEYGGNAAAYLRVRVAFYDDAATPAEISTDIIPHVAATYLDTSSGFTNGAKDVAINVTVPTSVGNSMQDANVTLKVVVEALQKANTNNLGSSGHEGENSADGVWYAVDQGTVSIIAL